MIDWKQIAAGAASGFLSAFIVDLMAWSKTPEGTTFGWRTAAKRWVAGAIAGAGIGAGAGAVSNG